MKKNRLISLIALGITSVSCVSIATVALANHSKAGAEGIPTVENLFSYTGVVSTNEATDGSTANKGMLLTARQSGASVKMLAEQTGIFEANLKGLTQNGQITLSNYSIKITDVESGEAFKIGVQEKNDYANVFVEVANGNRGGYYYTNESYNIHPEGVSAGMNGLMQQYTSFYRNSFVTEGNEGHIDSVKLRFDPQTMKVYLSRGIAPRPEDYWALVWDLDERINDGYDIGYSYSSFEEYTVELVFDSLFNEGNLLIYSMGGVDFSSAKLAENPVTIRADVALNAVRYRDFTIPTASSYDLFGKKDAQINVSVSNEGEALTVSEKNTVKPRKTGKMQITYVLASDPTVTKTYEVDVVGSADCTPVTVCEVEDVVGVNSVIQVPATTLKSNLFRKANEQLARVTVYRGGEVYGDLQNKTEDFSFTVAEVGSYEIKYVSPVNDLIAHSVNVEVSESEVALVAPTLSPVYLLNDTLTVAPAKAYLGDQALTVQAEVRFPSGKKVTEGEALLDEVGNYTLVHCYEHEGAKEYEQSFVVEQTADSMFKATDKKTEISYGAMSGNNTVSGVRLSLVENAPVLYEQIIDLSDNTKDDTLIELMAQPSTIGNNDITTLYLTFTDVENENNTMMIRLAYSTYTPHATWVTGKAGEKQWYTGWSVDQNKVEAATYHVIYGLISRHSFTQSPRSNYPYSAATMRIRYDAQENALYANPDVSSDTNLVCDFDDEMFFGANLWGGFTTGKVKMSIYGTGIASTGDVFILNVDGREFGKQTYTDDEKPVISPEYKGNEVPVAQVGEAYDVVAYTAIDAYSQVVSSSYKVFYNGTAVPVVNGAFVPTQAGVYDVEYQAVDAFGNHSKYTIHVNALEKVTTPTLGVNGGIVQSIAYGQTVVLPDYTMSGGAGGLKGSVTVTLNGEDIPVVGGRFVAEEIGTYLVTYGVTDYLGRTENQYYLIECRYGLLPMIDEDAISLPPAFIDGEQYVFDEYEAVFYLSEGNKNKIAPKIEVTDASGKYILDGLAYTPVIVNEEGTPVEKVTVSFIFEQEGAETLTITREVPAVYFMRDYGEQTKYFVTENATAEADAKGILFTATDVGNMKITFARALNVRDLRFVFSQFNSDNQLVLKNYGFFKVSLQDSRTPSQTVSVTYVKSGNGMEVTLNGRTIVSAFNKSGEVEFNYNHRNNAIIDVSDITLGYLRETVDGLPFDGFTSGEVYLSIEVCDIIGACALNFKSIDNQGFNEIPADRVDPVLWVNGHISGSYDVGAKIVIPTAGAYDVLSAISPVTVTVKGPDGSVILKQADATKEYTLTMGQYGMYFIRYEVRDASGRTKVVTMSAIVRDVAAPTLEFSKEISEEYRVGNAVSLKGYTVKDNKGAENVTVTVSVFKPDGSYEILTGSSYKFTQAGNYILIFMAIDGDENVTVYDYNIVVTK